MTDLVQTAHVQQWKCSELCSKSNVQWFTNIHHISSGAEANARALEFPPVARLNGVRRLCSSCSFRESFSDHCLLRSELWRHVTKSRDVRGGAKQLLFGNLDVLTGTGEAVKRHGEWGA